VGPCENFAHSTPPATTVTMHLVARADNQTNRRNKFAAFLIGEKFYESKSEQNDDDI
jgi:hypothetical protein